MQIGSKQTLLTLTMSCQELKWWSICSFWDKISYFLYWYLLRNFPFTVIRLFYVGALLNDSSCDPHLWIYGVWIDNGYCFICFGPTPWSRSNSDLCCGMQWKIIKTMCSQWERLKYNWKSKCYALMFVLMEECTTITNYGLRWYFVSSSLCHCWRFLK